MTPKRWVWELIQNAKDVNIDGKIRVQIEADLDGPDAHVTFGHNGAPFSAENIRFLIEQVSSKDRKEGQCAPADDDSSSCWIAVVPIWMTSLLL